MFEAPMNTSKEIELIDRLAAIPYSGAMSDTLDEMGWHNQSQPAAIVPGRSTAKGRPRWPAAISMKAS